MEIRPSWKAIYECLKTLSEVNEGKMGRIQRYVNKTSKGLKNMKWPTQISDLTIIAIQDHLERRCWWYRISSWYMDCFWGETIFSYCEKKEFLSPDPKNKMVSYKLTLDGKLFLEKYDGVIGQIKLFYVDNSIPIKWWLWVLGSLWIYKLFGEWIFHFFK